MNTLTAPRTLLRLLALILLADVTGAIVAVATDMHGLGTTIVSGTPINAPGPFIAVQLLMVLAAVRTRGRLVAIPCFLLAFLCFVSVVSGFGDGSYAEALSPAERAIQAGIVAPTTLLSLAAAARGPLAARPRTAAA